MAILESERISPSFGLVGETKMLEKRYSRVQSNLRMTLERNISDGKKKKKNKKSKYTASK